MKIIDAIQTVQALINTTQSQATGYQAQADSLLLVLAILQNAQEVGIPDFDAFTTAISAAKVEAPVDPIAGTPQIQEVLL